MHRHPQKLVGSLLLPAVAASWLFGSSVALAQGPSQQPFQDIYRRPNISTYNQIANFSNNPLAMQNIYQQTVLPQQQIQRQAIEQLQQRRQMGSIQNQVQQIRQGTQARQIDETIRPTGHASTYMNYSHYYQMR